MMKNDLKFFFVLKYPFEIHKFSILKIKTFILNTQQLNAANYRHGHVYQ